MDSFNECDINPCQNEGTCINRVGKFECHCPPSWNGIRCNIYDIGFTGGRGDSSYTTSTDWAHELERQECRTNKCAEKSRNGRCDEECNTIACKFDGQDCSFG